MGLMELMVLDHDVGVMIHSFHRRVLMELEYNFLHHVRVESFHGHEMEDSCVSLRGEFQHEDQGCSSSSDLQQ